MIVIITCWNCQTWVLWTCWDPWWSVEVCQDMRRKHSQAGTRSSSHSTGVLILSVDYSWLFCTDLLTVNWCFTVKCHSEREDIFSIVHWFLSCSGVWEQWSTTVGRVIFTGLYTLYTLYNTVHHCTPGKVQQSSKYHVECANSDQQRFCNVNRDQVSKRTKSNFIGMKMILPSKLNNFEIF